MNSALVNTVLMNCAYANMLKKIGIVYPQNCKVRPTIFRVLHRLNHKQILSLNKNWK